MTLIFQITALTAAFLVVQLLVLNSIGWALRERVERERRDRIEMDE